MSGCFFLKHGVYVIPYNRLSVRDLLQNISSCWRQ